MLSGVHIRQTFLGELTSGDATNEWQCPVQ